MREYYSIPLEDEEAQALLDISLLTEQPVKGIPFPGNIHNALKNIVLGKGEVFWYENHRIIGLYFSRSNFTQFPESIGNLIYLRFLSIHNCKFQTIPLTFKNLHNLEHLIFGNNPGSFSKILNLDFPDIFQDLKKLKIIHLKGPFNVYIPPSFIKLENLEELFIISCLFTPVRSIFLKNSNLEITDDSGLNTSQWCELPENIGNLKSLKRISLIYTYLEKLPLSLLNLTSLIEMDLNNSNRIKNIEIIFNIKSLVKLNLSSCGINYIPNTIKNLTNLKVLDISWNKLKEIPLEIKYCQKLTKLYLSRNSFFENFENWIQYLIYLPNLNYITISERFFELLPKELRNKKKIKIEQI